MKQTYSVLRCHAEGEEYRILCRTATPHAPSRYERPRR